MEPLPVSYTHLLEVKVDALCDAEAAVDVDAGGLPVEILRRNEDVAAISARRKDTFRVKENIQIPGNKPNIDRILWQEMKLQGVNTKPLDGEVHVCLLYTSCAGWQIMIDDKSLEKYRKASGGLGNRLANSIRWDEKRFRQYAGRCAFLNDDNLCDLYSEGGPGMLCRTCREYPRHTEEFEGCREISLSLSCEEAARIILGCEEPVRFVTKERPGEESYPDFDFFLYTKLADSRELMIGLLQRRELPVSLRISMVLALAHDLQRRIGRGEL